MNTPSTLRKNSVFIKPLLLATILATFILVQENALSRDQSQYLQIVQIGNNKIYVETANSMQDQEKGLMDRAFLPADQGMIFVYSTHSYVLFWMYHTLIPLDMIFIKNGKIIRISRNVPPCRSENKDDCAKYPDDNGITVDDVLEVNAGYAAQHNINEGDSVVFPAQ